MKRWYVVQVYTGFEEVVKDDIRARSAQEGLDEFIGDVLIPAGKSAQFFSDDDDKEKKEKIFPGYLLVQMEMTGETFRLVASTHRVTRFLGGEKPMPLSTAEVERIFSQIEGKISVKSPQSEFVSGGEVQIVSGPFSGFMGVVEKIDEEHEKLTVMVSIFGRLTPVELGFDQVNK